MARKNATMRHRGGSVVAAGLNPMDETSDSRDESPSRDCSPAGESSTSKARARKGVAKTPRTSGAGTKKKTTASAPRRDTAPPRTWWEQPWLWFGVIVATVVLAGGVSFAVDSDPEDIKPSGDTAAFCAAVTTYRQANAELKVGTGSTPEQLEAFRNSYLPIQATAPPEIKRTVDELAVSAFDETVAAVKRMQSEGGGLEKVQENEQTLARIEAKARRAEERYARYVQRACGIDLNVPVPTSSTTTPAPRPTPTGVLPGGPGETVTVPVQPTTPDNPPTTTPAAAPETSPDQTAR